MWLFLDLTNVPARLLGNVCRQYAVFVETSLRINHADGHMLLIFMIFIFLAALVFRVCITNGRFNVIVALWIYHQLGPFSHRA